MAFKDATAEQKYTLLRKASKLANALQPYASTYDNKTALLPTYESGIDDILGELQDALTAVTGAGASSDSGESSGESNSGDSSSSAGDSGATQ